MLLKKVVILGIRMRHMEYLTGGVQTFVLIHHNAAQRKSVAMAAKLYSTVIGG